jgi:hypothetical protein
MTEPYVLDKFRVLKETNLVYPGQGPQISMEKEEDINPLSVPSPPPEGATCKAVIIGSPSLTPPFRSFF